jgi:NAD-dependent SIR2 family protein deacetylase
MNIILNDKVIGNIPSDFRCDSCDFDVPFSELHNFDMNGNLFTCNQCEESKQGKERFYL